MSKASTVRLLYAERCSVAEIAAVVGWKLCDVRWFLRTWVAFGDERDEQIRRKRG